MDPAISTAPLKFTLEKRAKNAGGDKYVCDTQPDFNIYIPQGLSRVNNVPVQSLWITIGKSDG